MGAGGSSVEASDDENLKLTGYQETYIGNLCYVLYVYRRPHARVFPPVTSRSPLRGIDPRTFAGVATLAPCYPPEPDTPCYPPTFPPMRRPTAR